MCSGCANVGWNPVVLAAAGPVGTGSFICLAVFDFVDLRKPLSEKHADLLLVIRVLLLACSACPLSAAVTAGRWLGVPVFIFRFLKLFLFEILSLYNLFFSSMLCARAWYG